MFLIFTVSYLLCFSFFYSGFATEIDLSIHESSFYSPNGEDGIFARIFASVKPISRFCVECGAYDGITNSMTYLLRNQGWRGILFDRSYEISSLGLYKEFITCDNVNIIFDKYGVPEIFDLLTLDTGYNDYYIWQAIDARYRPSVVCIAYNAFHLPDEDKIVIPHPYFCGDDTNYFGASILALYNLGLSKGYGLVYAEQSGRHLFFIRQDVLEKNNVSFKNANDVAAIYRHPEYENGQGGVRQDPKRRKYLSSKEVLKR
jgi:hypothetical protein